MTIDKLGKRIAGSASRLRVKSALNPALWLCAIALPLTLVAVPLMPSELPTWKIALIFIPICVPTAGFFFLLFFDRDKLQSEEYQIQKQSMEMIAQKGEAPRPPSELEIVENPEVKVINDGR